LPQIDAQLQDHIIFSIPWGHQKCIIDQCDGNAGKALFYVQKTLENNWSRSILLNFLDTDLYEHQGKAITIFDKRLPDIESDLAQQLTELEMPNWHLKMHEERYKFAAKTHTLACGMKVRFFFSLTTI
jgi:predicted nuclease of restriction endonuclease-like (RecB) superfamily